MKYAIKRRRQLLLPLTGLLLLSIIFVQEIAASTISAGGSCQDCHAQLKGNAQRVTTEWQESVHAAVGVGCTDCHGGNPKATTFDSAMWAAPGFIGTPDRTAIPRLCARCHSDPVRMRPFNLPTSQYDQYLTSVHGKRLIQGDTRVATCIDCHGSHDIRRKNDVQARVYKTNIADTCGRCHSDAQLMKPYGIPTDQRSEYLRSIHGHKLVMEHDLAAPSCADCHGTHGATPPGVREVGEVCGRCHTLLEEQFSKSPHQQALTKHGKPRCVDCHSNHGITKPSDAKLITEEPGGCKSCHPTNSVQFAVARQLYEAITGVQDMYNRTQQQLLHIASLHEDIADGQAALDQAYTSLKEARANVHAVSLAGIHSQVENANLSIKKAQAVAREGALRSFWRRTNVAIAAFVFLSISGLLFFKWRTLHRQWLRTAGGGEAGQA